MIEAIICDDDKCCRCSVVEIVKNFFNKQKKTVKIKGGKDMITAQDIQIMMITLLKILFLVIERFIF